jgi:hypothetical protein
MSQHVFYTSLKCNRAWIVPVLSSSWFQKKASVLVLAFLLLSLSLSFFLGLGFYETFGLVLRSVLWILQTFSFDNFHKELRFSVPTIFLS